MTAREKLAHALALARVALDDLERQAGDASATELDRLRERVLAGLRLWVGAQASLPDGKPRRASRTGRAR